MKDIVIGNRIKSEEIHRYQNDKKKEKNTYIYIHTYYTTSTTTTRIVLVKDRL